jgi:hypothetical protein
MPKPINTKLAECPDMAIRARQKANAAVSRTDQGFWHVMEARWLHLAQTYRETERLARDFRRSADIVGH